MLTQDMIDAFDAMAGPNRDWQGAMRSTHRPPSTVRKALREDLIERQGGLCPICGNVLRFAQFNHVVSRGPGVQGFIEGNIFAGCATCNLDCALTYGEATEDGKVIDGGVIPITAFKRADIVPMEWTPFPILKARQRDSK